MDNPIQQYINSLKKKANQMAVSKFVEDKKKLDQGYRITVKEKKEITEKISLDFDLRTWVFKKVEQVFKTDFHSFIPHKKHVEIFEFLSLDIGYKRNVTTGFEDSSSILKTLLKCCNEDEFNLLRTKAQKFNKDLLLLYQFFKEEIDEAYTGDTKPLDLVLEKIKTLSEKAKNTYRVSHAPKFSHPDAKTPKIYAIAEKNNDGFLRTGNAVGDFDMHLNAKFLPVFKFLSLKISNKSILEYLISDPDKVLEATFGVSQEVVDEWRLGFLININFKETKSNQLVKQVYFPVGDEYHLLSIVFPSSIAFEMKKEISTIEGSRFRKKDKQDEYETIPDITIQRYGGKHPENISSLNNKNQYVYLLPSMPPKLDKQEIRLPKNNFFIEMLWVKEFSDSFKFYHKLIANDYENAKIKNAEDNIVHYVVHQVIEKMWIIRQHEGGWSVGDNYARLPMYQKIWLDNSRKKERENNDEWLDKVINEFGRWFIYAYKKELRKKAKQLDDYRLSRIKDAVYQNKEGLR